MISGHELEAWATKEWSWDGGCLVIGGEEIGVDLVAEIFSSRSPPEKIEGAKGSVTVIDPMETHIKLKDGRCYRLSMEPNLAHLIYRE